MLKIDFKNAFNLLNRKAFVQATSKMFPGLEVDLVVLQPVAVVSLEPRTSFSQNPEFTAPLFVVAPVAYRSNRRPSTSVSKVDGGIVGSPELPSKVWEILKKGGVPLGLELNSKKCEWSWLNPDCNLVCPIDGVPITPTSEIQILGFPSVLRSLLRVLSKGTF